MFFGSNEFFSAGAGADLAAPGVVAGIGGGGACSLDGFSAAGFAGDVWALALNAQPRIVPMIRKDFIGFIFVSNTDDNVTETTFSSRQKNRRSREPMFAANGG